MRERCKKKKQTVIERFGAGRHLIYKVRVERQRVVDIKQVEYELEKVFLYGLIIPEPLKAFQNQLITTLISTETYLLRANIIWQQLFLSL